MKHAILQDLPVVELPYEKAKRLGVSALKDQELLAILIRTGTTKKSVMSLTEELYREAGESLLAMARWDARKYRSIDGIGEVKAIQILAAFEIAKRLTRTSLAGRKVLASPETIYLYYRDELRLKEQEYVYLISLDTRLSMIDEQLMSIGTVNAALISPREIFRAALTRGAVGIVLVHNHPSGDPTPSGADIRITKVIAEVGELLQIPLYDHVIIGDHSYISLKQEGYFESESKENK